MNLSNVRLFILIVQMGNLSKAAEALGISPMMASRRLTALEDDLGVKLFHRNTRSVSLTQEGDEFLPHATVMLEAEESVRSNISKKHLGASGTLRVTAPSAFAKRELVPLIPDLLTANPNMKIDLQMSDEIVDIIGRGYDVAIRVATLKDSNLVARKLWDNPRVLCASPSYLKKHGKPENTQYLKDHQCIRLSSVPHWNFVDGGKIRSISIEGRISSNSVEGVRDFCIAGLGIAQLTRFDIQTEISAKKLIEIELSDVSPQPLSVWAILPPGRNTPSRVNEFLNALKNARP